MAEDQYPENLDPIFSKSDSATDLNHTLELLKWNRKTDRSMLDSGVYERMAAAQENLRATLQLTLTTDNPWEKHTFKDWRHRVTNICLQAVQKALENSDHRTPPQQLQCTVKCPQRGRTPDLTLRVYYFIIL